MPRHTRQMIEQLLPEAETLVADGAARIRAQESRVTELERKGRRTDQSKKLLAIMKQTQELQISHVQLLRRELAGSDDRGLPNRPLPHA
jgi:hypothetical protein